jgi:hypothetical protein
MAAPVFLQQGNASVVTTGNLTVVIPAVEQANDILVVAMVAWVPNTTTGANTVAAPTGWTKFTPAVTTITGGLIDAEYAFFWKRAVGGDADPVFVRPTGWDTGTDTCWYGRSYVIRGCATTGDPWDTITNTAISTAANPAFPAITVSGTERLAVVFAVKTDNTALPTAATGYTVQLETNTTTGTDAAINSYTISSTNSSVSAVTPTGGVAPAQGGTVYFGISFKSPAVVTTDRTASGSGAGTESATRNFFSILNVTATGSGTGTETATGANLTTNRTASGSGAGTESATGVFAAPITRTADGSGSGTESATRNFFTPVVFSRTASGSGTGTQTAVRVVVKVRTALTDGGRGGAIAGFTPKLTGFSSNSWPTTGTEIKAMSFVGNGGTVASVSFAMARRNAGETGLLYAKLYAHTGTYGTTGTGTGAALATSNPIDITTISTSSPLGRVNTTFTFPDGQKYVLANGTNYVIGVQYTGTGVVNPVSIEGAQTSVNNYYAGNGSTFSIIWSTITLDYCFMVEGVSATGAVTRVRTATGSGTGTQSATGQILITTNRTATGSGTGTESSTELRTVLRTATSAGTSSETADDQLDHFKTATGSGSGTSLAHIALNRVRTGSGTALGTTGGSVTFIVTRIRTATGSGSGTESATPNVIRFINRTATGSGIGTQTATGNRFLVRFASGVGYSDSTADDQLTHFKTATGFGIGIGFADEDITHIRTATGTGSGTSSITYEIFISAVATGFGQGSSTATSIHGAFRNATGTGNGFSVAISKIPPVGINWAYWGADALIR